MLFWKQIAAQAAVMLSCLETAQREKGIQFTTLCKLLCLKDQRERMGEAIDRITNIK